MVAELSHRKLREECRKAQVESQTQRQTIQLISEVLATFCPGVGIDFSARAEVMVTGFLLHVAALPIEPLPLRLSTHL
jgi:hypothetical protein